MTANSLLGPKKFASGEQSGSRIPHCRLETRWVEVPTHERRSPQPGNDLW